MTEAIEAMAAAIEKCGAPYPVAVEAAKKALAALQDSICTQVPAWTPIETLPDDYIQSVLLVDIWGNITAADIDSVIDQITGSEIIFYRVLGEDDTAEQRVFRRDNPWTHWMPIHAIPAPGTTQERENAGENRV